MPSITAADSPPAEPEPITVPPGLKGVAVADTTVGDVRGRQGFYHYRQYSATDLATTRSFEDVWQLLVDGALPPDGAAAAAFAAEVAPLRAVPDAVLAALPAVAATATPGGLAGLRSAMSLLGSAAGMRPMWDLSPAERRSDLLRLAAATPTLLAALWRLGHGQDPITPDPELGHAANYLWMLHGQRPDPDSARALEQYLIVTADHGFNASTFTARVIASTGADAAAAMTGAIGALSGPLHGGAPSRALETLDAIGRPERAEAWVRSALERGERIMGFGHPVYVTDDPRSLLLRDVARRRGGPLVALAVEVESTVNRLLAELRPDRPLYANVEYYAGVVMDGVGLQRAQFSATFAAARVLGWSANIAEQAGDRKIIRPVARYVGPEAPVPVPSIG
ncbi:citrate synthase [Acidiferrimicrobium sp. IK]|uniref:citrate synthase n=1 Tax=Acidiferrimicrobium sp. IK TaxID=2871700 RepID=UPI0021CB64C9|nr:citrate synthase [Acidiferrimicrobium sp. IK]MCU4184549.1 citrate synthase [Acidiferrimicrobium sp. IK]